MVALMLLMVGRDTPKKGTMERQVCDATNGSMLRLPLPKLAQHPKTQKEFYVCPQTAVTLW